MNKTKKQRKADLHTKKENYEQEQEEQRRKRKKKADLYTEKDKNEMKKCN